MDSKDGNPKQAFGDKKLPLHLVPCTMAEYASLAFLEGALKYGQYNWRVKGVRVSTYLSALRRHLDKYESGQWADPETHVPHLANALACVAIILDADRMGKLTDDRPPSLPQHDTWMNAQSDIVEHLKTIFADKNPHQYTKQDTETLRNAIYRFPSHIRMNTPDSISFYEKSTELPDSVIEELQEKLKDHE